MYIILCFSTKTIVNFSCNLHTILHTTHIFAKNMADLAAELEKLKQRFAHLEKNTRSKNGPKTIRQNQTTQPRETVQKNDQKVSNSSALEELKQASTEIHASMMANMSKAPKYMAPSKQMTNGNIWIESENFPPKNLPILSKKEDIVRSVDCYDVTSLIAETGSGKSLMGGLFLTQEYEVLVAMPTVLAVNTMYDYVKNQMHDPSHVGYARQSDNNYDWSTSRIVYATTRHVINTLLDVYDRVVNKGQPYTLPPNLVIFCDEAHMTNTDTTVLLRLVLLLKKASPLFTFKIVFASATMGDLPDFEGFTHNEIKCSGRIYDVNMIFSPREIEPKEKETLEQVASKWCYDTIRKIINEKSGILVFLPGEQAILDFTENLSYDPMFADVEIIPLCSNLFTDEIAAQLASEIPEGKKRIIVSTDIAQSSVTLTGVDVAVNPGLHRMTVSREYGGRYVTELNTCTMSQSSFVQSAGRAGRTQHGDSYIMLTKDQFALLPKHDTPELDRTMPYDILLLMYKYKINPREIINFSEEGKLASMTRSLIEWKLINRERDGSYVATAMGLSVSSFPVSTEMSILLYKTIQENDKRLMLIMSMIVAIVETPGYLLYVPPAIKEKATYIKEHFSRFASDNDISTALNMLFAIIMSNDTVKYEDDIVAKKKVNWAWKFSFRFNTIKSLRSTLMSILNSVFNKKWKNWSKSQGEIIKFIDDILFSGENMSLSDWKCEPEKRVGAYTTYYDVWESHIVLTLRLAFKMISSQFESNKVGKVLRKTNRATGTEYIVFKYDGNITSYNDRLVPSDELQNEIDYYALNIRTSKNARGDPTRMASYVFPVEYNDPAHDEDTHDDLYRRSASESPSSSPSSSQDSGSDNKFPTLGEAMTQRVKKSVKTDTWSTHAKVTPQVQRVQQVQKSFKGTSLGKERGNMFFGLLDENE